MRGEEGRGRGGKGHKIKIKIKILGGLIFVTVSKNVGMKGLMQQILMTWCHVAKPTLAQR